MIFSSLLESKPSPKAEDAADDAKLSDECECINGKSADPSCDCPAGGLVESIPEEAVSAADVSQEGDECECVDGKSLDPNCECGGGQAEGAVEDIEPVAATEDESAPEMLSPEEPVKKEKPAALKKAAAPKKEEVSLSRKTHSQSHKHSHSQKHSQKKAATSMKEFMKQAGPGDVLNPNAAAATVPNNAQAAAATNPAAAGAAVPTAVVPPTTTETITVTPAEGSKEWLDAELKSVRERLARLRAEITLWSDHDTWNQKMVSQRAQIEEQMKSKALADALSDIRYEMHQLTVPVFVEVLTDKIEILRKQEEDLVSQLKELESEAEKSKKGADSGEDAAKAGMNHVSLILVCVVGAALLVGVFLMSRMWGERR